MKCFLKYYMIPPPLPPQLNTQGIRTALQWYKTPSLQCVGHGLGILYGHEHFSLYYTVYQRRAFSRTPAHPRTHACIKNQPM